MTDALLLCRVDTAHLHRKLTWAADHLIDDLQTTFTRTDHLGASSTRGAGGSQPLPWGEHAAVATRALGDTIVAWAIECTAGQDPRDPLSNYRRDDLVALARWLRRNLATLRAHPEAGLAYRQLTDVIRRGATVVDLPAVVSTFDVGPCPEDIGSNPCPGVVRASIGAGDRASMMRCPSCTREWGTTEWLRAGKRILVRMGALSLT